MRGRGSRWWCPYCPARGRAATPALAYAAGVDHFLAFHDDERRRP